MDKNSKQKTVLVLLGLLIILLLVFFALKGSNQRKEKAEAKKQTEETVHIYETDTLAKISYEDSEGTAMAFEKDGDEWKYTEDTTLPLMVDTMSAMETAFADITAVKEIQEPDELSDYGLDEPAYKLLLTDEDGKATLLLIGNQSGENYYIMCEDDEKVYTVSSNLVSQMVWELSSLVEKENFAVVTESTFVKEVVTKPDGTETTFDSANEEQADAVTAVAQALAGMYFTECADYHVTDETLSTYGLDEANRTKVVLTYTETDDDGASSEKEAIFYVGTKDSTGTYYYVQLDGSQMVNTVLADSIDAALGQAE